MTSTADILRAAKACKMCGETKPLDSFHRCKLGVLGRHPYCKDCSRNYHSRRRQENRDHIRLTQNAWSERNRDKVRATARMTYARGYAANPAPFLERSRRWAARHPERTKAIQKARAAVATALRRGDLKRSAVCESCGQTERLNEAAHYDYSRPLDIRWLCPCCHRQWDQAQPKSRAIELAEQEPDKC